MGGNYTKGSEPPNGIRVTRRTWQKSLTTCSTLNAVSGTGKPSTSATQSTLTDARIRANDREQNRTKLYLQGNRVQALFLCWQVFLGGGKRRNLNRWDEVGLYLYVLWIGRSVYK